MSKHWPAVASVGFGAALVFLTQRAVSKKKRKPAQKLEIKESKVRFVFAYRTELESGGQQ